MRRVSVVGTSCSGKTTLARILSTRYDLPHVELDALYWGPAWTPVPVEVFRSRVSAALAGERWVVDGGYSPVRDLTWARVDTVIWLDYPLPIVLARWARRTLHRLRSREEFWPGTGNTERLDHVVGRDSLLWWILRTHRRRQSTLAAALDARPEIRAIRLGSPAATRHWLASL